MSDNYKHFYSARDFMPSENKTLSNLTYNSWKRRQDKVKDMESRNIELKIVHF